MTTNGPTSEQQARDERIKYFQAFNSTMQKIWMERIVLLHVVDTRQLLRSVPEKSFAKWDTQGTTAYFMLTFKQYGIYQDYGTGRETPRGNPGDIGRPKKRQRRKWFSTKWFASVMNIRDFMGRSLGRSFAGAFTEAFNRVDFRSQVLTKDYMNTIPRVAPPITNR